MQLSSDLFDRIVGTHGAGTAPERLVPSPGSDESGETPASTRPSIIMPAGARVVERRHVRRTRFGQRVKMCLEAELSIGLWDTVMLQDISVAGLSYLSERWQDLNTAVHVTVGDRTGTPVRLRCVVRRCERGGMGGVCYTVGVTFDALLSDIPGGAVEGSSEFAPAVHRSPDVRNAGPSTEPLGGFLNWFRSTRLLSAFTRNYDDYSTVSLGGQPSRAK